MITWNKPLQEVVQLHKRDHHCRLGTYETKARRHPFQNGKHYDFEGKRNNKSSYMDPYSEENDEHEAIAAVREKLGDEY